MDMIICGLSMEMRAAEEMGTVGKCISCYYLDSDGKNEYCKGKLLEKRKENCEDWFVDMR